MIRLGDNMKRFFPEIMEFYGFKEFFQKRIVIKEQFDLLDDSQQYIYRGYIYETPFVTDYIRNAMWDFLTGDCPEDNIVFIYSDYLRHKNKKDT